MMKITATVALALAASTSTSSAFVTPNAAVVSRPQQCTQTVQFMSESETTESAFVADVDAPAEEGDKTFDAVEKMGRGAAKVRK